MDLKKEARMFQDKIKSKRYRINKGQPNIFKSSSNCNYLYECNSSETTRKCCSFMNFYHSKTGRKIDIVFSLVHNYHPFTRQCLSKNFPNMAKDFVDAYLCTYFDLINKVDTKVLLKEFRIFLGKMEQTKNQFNLLLTGIILIQFWRSLEPLVSVILTWPSLWYICLTKIMILISLFQKQLTLKLY